MLLGKRMMRPDRKLKAVRMDNWSRLSWYVAVNDMSDANEFDRRAA